jgi:hypothetical protein
MNVNECKETHFGASLRAGQIEQERLSLERSDWLNTGTTGKANPFAGADGKQLEKIVAGLLDRTPVVRKRVLRNLPTMIANLRSALLLIDRCIIGLEYLSAVRSEKQRMTTRAACPKRNRSVHSQHRRNKAN